MYETIAAQAKTQTEATIHTFIVANHIKEKPMIKFLYRLITPKHPRGWIDVIYETYEKNDEILAKVFTKGMSRWKLNDLEIIDVPQSLIGYAHGILFELTGYMKNQQPINADENFGGFLIHNNQRLVNYATFRNSGESLRIVDFETNLESGFPKKLFASYLIEGSIKTKNPAKQEHEIKKAIEIFDSIDTIGEKKIESAFKNGHNVNNYAAFDRLGDILLDRGDNKGWDFIYQAISRCPNYAKELSNDINKEFNGNYPSDDERFKFWGELDDKKIREIINTVGNKM